MSESVQVANDNIVQFFIQLLMTELFAKDLVEDKNLGGCVVNLLKPQDESLEQINQCGVVGVGSIEEI